MYTSVVVVDIVGGLSCIVAPTWAMMMMFQLTIYSKSPKQPYVAPNANKVQCQLIICKSYHYDVYIWLISIWFMNISICQL